MKTMIHAGLVAVALFGLAACGDGKPKDGGDAPKDGGDKPADTGGSAGAGGGSKAYSAAEHKGSISGSVKLGGAAPAARKLAFAGDEFCTSAVAGTDVFDEDWVVNADGTVPNAVVTVKSGPITDFKFAAPTDRNLVISQKGCMYMPHVFTVMVGEKFHVTNDDQTQHNVHTRPARGVEFNKAQAPGGKDEFVYDKKQSVPFSCDVHSWMSAHCLVLEHPFSAVTDAAGRFEIKGLPAGEYEFSVWTAKLGKATFKATIADAAVTQDATLAQ